MSRSRGKVRMHFKESDYDWTGGVAEWYYYTKKNHKTRGCWSGRFPKYYRKIVNKERRNKDKEQLYREVNLIDYIGNYSKWNANDNDPWYYFW